MKHLVIMDKKIDAEKLGNAISGAFSLSVAENLDSLSEKAAEELPSAVLINADSPDTAPEKAVALARSGASAQQIPIVLYTYNNALRHQELLCSCGADDVLIFPLFPGLIVKRLNMLTSSVLKVDDEDSEFNFDELINAIEEKNSPHGAFCVRQSEFARIYQFVTRGLERSEKNVQVLLLTLSCNKKEICHQSLARVMKVLYDAVKLCLRRGDISSVCSQSQVAVLLMGADDNGGHLVANRILSSFYSECDDGDFRLHYDIREININEMNANNS